MFANTISTKWSETTVKNEPTIELVVFDIDEVSFGIPIDTVPTLVCIPLDLIRTLPDDFRTTNPVGIASHIAMISNSTTALTIFILA